MQILHDGVSLACCTVDRDGADPPQARFAHAACVSPQWPGLPEGILVFGGMAEASDLSDMLTWHEVQREQRCSQQSTV